MINFIICKYLSRLNEPSISSNHRTCSIFILGAYICAAPCPTLNG